MERGIEKMKRREEREGKNGRRVKSPKGRKGAKRERVRVRDPDKQNGREQGGERRGGGE